MNSNHNQNDLKNFLVNQYEDWIYPNRKVLIFLVSFVLIILAVLFFVSRSNVDVKAKTWEQFFKVLDSPDPVKPLESFAGIKDGFFEYQAAITAGQLLLAQACDTGFSDKSQAAEKLEKALTLFENVYDKRKVNVKFKRQAALGIAQVHEAMASVRAGSNELEIAIADYKKIIELWQGEYEAKIAESQLALLTRDDTKKFYDRYATANADRVPNPDEFNVEINKNDPLLPSPNSLIPDVFFKNSAPEKPKDEPTEKSEIKPTETPKDESTEKSEIKPTEKPKDESTEKPKDEPTEKPKD
ncbi:MAG: hypothetical protein LBE18_11090 [Planctomycetaceae bacterium]|jgi:hypothetical protein|nr:hypothetical protein [Planctomycetaceae bacterium]